MANAFNKEERVAFEDIMLGFEDYLVLSNAVSKYRTSDQGMERSNDTIWRPQPYIATSQDGPDVTGSYTDATQLSVPASLGFKKVVPWTLTASQLRDALQEGRLGDAAKQRLASDINVAIMNTAANEGTLFVKRTAAASGFADLAACETIMNEQGVPMHDRYAALSTSDYNNMAANLASRTLGGSAKSLTAYEKAYVGEIASFDTFKLDYANSQALSPESSCTLNAANQYYTPLATSTATGGQINVDNRYQTITTTGTQPAVGDAITIAGVNAVHHITKQDTGNLKTFRVIAVPSGTTLQISPPIISNGGSTDAEAAYQNVTATPATNAALVALNTVAGKVNPFWQKDALEILPGNYAIPSDAGANVLRGTTSNGIALTMSKFYDIDTLVTKYRMDIVFGVVCKQPEMAGVMMFSQT